MQSATYTYQLQFCGLQATAVMTIQGLGTNSHSAYSQVQMFPEHPLSIKVIETSVCVCACARARVCVCVCVCVCTDNISFLAVHKHSESNTQGISLLIKEKDEWHD